jgi:hypothetical protein
MNNRFEGTPVKGNREGLPRLVLLRIMLLNALHNFCSGWASPCPLLGTFVLSIRFMNNRFEGTPVKGNREGLPRLGLMRMMLIRLMLPRLMEQRLW